MRFYAHSGQLPDRSDWQLLKDHLHSVAELSQARAQVFGGADWAHLAGLLHDLGKYSDAFQNRLNGSDQRADHSTAGAKLVVDHLHRTQGAQWGMFAKLLAFVIAGHHAGLANGVDDGHERSTLKQRMGMLSAGAPQAARQLAAGATEAATPAAPPAQLPASTPSSTPEQKTAEADLIAEIEQLGQINPRS